MPRASRGVERFYAETYAPFLTRGHNALGLLVASVLAGAVLAFKLQACQTIL